MRLPLLLAAGLGLLAAELLSKEEPQLIPATSAELLGKWYIERWAGNLPIPKEKRHHPLPPFTFIMNSIQKLEFRMNIMKAIGCQQFKLPLLQSFEPGYFSASWRHRVFIGFLPGKEHAIAHFKGRIEHNYYHMMKLFGRTLDENSEALQIFENFVESKGLNKTDIIDPPHIDACVLSKS